MVNNSTMKNKILIGCIVCCSCTRNCDTEPTEIKSEYWNNRIDTIYISKNHATPTMLISNTNEFRKEIGMADLRGLYNHASIGDTIYKPKGSLAFQLKKRDTTMVFYSECEGKEIR